MVGELLYGLQRGVGSYRTARNPNDIPVLVERQLALDRELSAKYRIASVTWDFNGAGGYNVRVVCRRRACDTVVEVDFDV